MSEAILECASYLAYTPRPESDVERESKEAMRRVKSDSVWPGSDLKTTSYIAQSVAKTAAVDFADIFMEGKAAMVPVPKSSLISKGDLWVPHNMAKALAEYGLGIDVVPCLKRDKAVRKAARSSSDTRPKVADHLKTIAVEAVAPPDRVVLVDDVVTTGATLIGAAQSLRGAFPGVQITAFAAMRTESFGNIKKIKDPKVEIITLYSSGKTHRE